MLKSKAKLVEKQNENQNENQNVTRFEKRVTFKTFEKGNLLDVGAGTGYFANEMKNRNWNVSAIEKNAEARQFIKENWNIEAQDDDALFSLPENSFDVITLWHVLEHLEHLNEVMKKLHSLLKNDGTLVIALPNADSYDARKYKSFWAAYDLPRHLWHFSPKTFSLLASNNGFEIIKTKRMLFDVFYICLLSEKYRGKKFGFVRAFFMASIAWLLSVFCVKNTSSLIYVLKKQ